MNNLYFVTGNMNKLAEVRAILPDVISIKLDLPEIQSLNALEIIAKKLEAAVPIINEGKIIEPDSGIIVEDTSLYLECLNGFPGPLIKWMMADMGYSGIAELVHMYDNHFATAKTVIGYTDGKHEVEFFEGSIGGLIVSPRGETTFGWDPIFEPLVSNKTFAEMSKEEKNKVSMRRMAVRQLRDYLLE